MSPRKGYTVTGKELLLAISLSLLGFVFSMRTWLLWLNTLTPLEGLAIYYVLLYVSLFLLSKAGLVVFGFEIKDPLQTAGLLMITFAFFLVVDMSSAYVQYVTMGNVTGASTIFFQCEDGTVFSLWSWLLPDASMYVLRLLTYCLTPFVLSVIGAFMVRGKVKIQS